MSVSLAWRVALVAAALTLQGGAVTAATITVVNLDGAGEGFNDSSATAPVGGNTGTTLGEQRLLAFQHAAQIWGDLLGSDVEIEVGATFDPMDCSVSSAVLGFAGPETVHRDFPGALQPGTFYPQALANALAGVDLSPSIRDVFASFNSAIGTTCSFPEVWYYGLDANPPIDELDFVSVVLHEIGHGLGFLSFVDLGTGAKFGGFDHAYIRHLEDHSTGEQFPAMSNGDRAAAHVDTGDLHWSGAAVVAASGFLTAGRHAGSGHVEVYAPGVIQPGSSVSHFSTALSPDDIMEPFYTTANHDPGLALELMYDLGWLPNDCGDGVLDAGEECDDDNSASGDGCTRCAIDLCYSCSGAPSLCAPDDLLPCDDGDACTASDHCDAGVCASDATPLSGCLQSVVSGKSLLLLKDKAVNRGDKMLFKWLRGDATTLADFGDPTSTTGYQLCLRDKPSGLDRVFMSVAIPSGAAWETKNGGFKYKDSSAASDGAQVSLLKEGEAGRAKIIVKAKGAALPMGDLNDLSLPLTVQLSNGSVCWEATFENNLLVNDAQLLKAKSE